METVLELARGLEASPYGSWMRESSWAYPTANTLHLVGMVLLIGAIGILDLRIAGAMRGLPLAPLSAALTPIAVVGLIILLATGFSLFSADASALVRSNVFRTKIALVGLAIANAAAFRLRWGGGFGQREPAAIARGLAIGSIGLWFAILVLGRLIAYA